MEESNGVSPLAFHTILSRSSFSFDPVNERIMFDPCNDYVFKFDSNRKLIKKDLRTWKITEVDYTPTGSSNNPSIIKYSPDDSILSLRTSIHEITFIPTDKKFKPFTQQCNITIHPDNVIKDFFWISETHVFIITKYGIDAFECNLIDTPNQPLKRIAEKSISISWFVYYAKIFMYLSDDDDKFLKGFHFRKQKSNKIEFAELETIQIQSKVPLLREDIVISKIYDKVYCIFIDNLQHKLYLFQNRYNKSNPKYKANEIILDLSTNGPIRLSIIDNLIISHNITKNTSMIFDIKMDTNDKEIHCIVDPLPIAFFEEKNNDYKVIGKYTDCQFIFPDSVVNKGTGEIRKIGINIDNISKNIEDTNLLINFLLRRKEGKSVIINEMKKWSKKRTHFNDISISFSLINFVLASFEKRSVKPKNMPNRSLEVAKEKILKYWGSDNNDKDTYSLLNSHEKEANIYHKGQVVIGQEEMYTEVFVPMEEENEDYKFKVAVVSEYIKNLNFSSIKVHSFIYELVIDLLVRNNKFYQLHQLLQYYVINDSNHVACQLLYIEQKYPPALQLALDMLKRLNEPSQIIEVLFTKGMVLTALKYLNSLQEKSLIKPLAPRFLEEARKLNDTTLFHITFNYFKSLNLLDPNSDDYRDFCKLESKMLNDED